MNGSKLSKLVRTEPVRKELGRTRPSKNKTNKKRKSRTHKRERSPTTPQREENRKKRQPEEKEATRNVKKGRMPLKRSKWRTA